MSTFGATSFPLGAAPPAGRPGVWSTLVSVFRAQVAVYVILFAASIPLSLLARVGFSGGGLGVYRGWTITGAWSAVAAASWWMVVSVVVGAFVRNALADRFGPTPSLVWTALGAGVGGYAGLLLGHTGAGRVGLATLLTALLVRALAFDANGYTRPTPAWWPRPRRALAIGLAALIVGPFALLHPFAADGSGSGWDGSGSAEIGLSTARLPMTVTGVSLVGRNLRAVGPVRIGLALGGGEPTSRHSPLHVPAGQTLWIGYSAPRRGCAGTATVTGVRLHYRMLGLPLTMVVRAQSDTVLGCG